MATRKRFTKREDNKIIREVSENSENINYCFARLSQEMHRSESTLRTRYYRYLRPKLKNDPKKAAFILGDKAKLNPMTKNVKRGTPVEGIYLDRAKIKSILEAVLSVL